MSKNRKPIRVFRNNFILSLLMMFCFSFANGQGKNDKQTTQTPTLKRTTTKTETRSFSYGGSLIILGAPNGSVTIEGWNKSQVEVTADIEIQANTEDDLTKLAAVNGFIIDEDFNSLKLLTVGTHDKAYMKRYAKNFPKQLLGLPWKIDYRIKVPAMCDLDINLGKGAISLKGVEGAITINAAESNATLTLTGGYVRTTIGRGTVSINITSRSWRGTGAITQLGAGEMNLTLPVGFNAYITADVLRIGKIENSYPTLKPKQFTTPTEKSIEGVAGTGGTNLKFVVGDGTLRIRSTEQ
jgi:hypothetical protein